MTGAVAPRWRALDGLRAVAVSAVVLFHADVVAPAGFLGVDVFFVLSGFLITGLLAAEVGGSGSTDVLGFYRRRLARLFPALALLCGAVAAAALALGRGTAPHVVAGALASATYVANLWRDTGHAMPLLEHTWTLALEWQFHLVWPFVVLAPRRARWAALLSFLAALVLLVPVFTGVVRSSPALDSYSHGIGLLVGGALAVAVRHGAARRWVSGAGAPAAVALVLLLAAPAGVVGAGAGRGEGLLGLAAVAVSCPVIVACTTAGPVAHVLGPRPWCGSRHARSGSTCGTSRSCRCS